VGWSGRYVGIGIDAEPAEPLGPGLERLICTPAERERIARDATPELDWVRVTFCAKEAVHKAVAPGSGVTMGFHDVEIDFGPDGRFAVRYVGETDPRLPELGRIDGRHAVADGLILTTAILARTG
jgi:4'-phosphopantetheinyl transferase EntD